MKKLLIIMGLLMFSFGFGNDHRHHPHHGYFSYPIGYHVVILEGPYRQCPGVIIEQTYTTINGQQRLAYVIDGYCRQVYYRTGPVLEIYVRAN